MQLLQAAAPLKKAIGLISRVQPDTKLEVDRQQRCTVAGRLTSTVPTFGVDLGFGEIRAQCLCQAVAVFRGTKGALNCRSAPAEAPQSACSPRSSSRYVLRPDGQLTLILRSHSRGGPEWLPNAISRSEDEIIGALAALDSAGYEHLTQQANVGSSAVITARASS